MHAKSAILFSIIVLISLNVNAQFKKGMRMAGASIGTLFLNSGSADISYPGSTSGFSTKTTSFGIELSPSVGWFISNNTVVGVTLAIRPSSEKVRYSTSGNTFQEDKSTTFHIGFGGFARNYFKSSSSFIPFGQAGLNMGISSASTSGFFYGGSGASAYKTTYDGDGSGGFFANASLTLGLTKLLSPHTGLDFFASYNYSYNKNTIKTTTLRDDGNNGSIDLTIVNEPTTKFTNHGFVFGVGFQVFLEARN